MKCLDIRQYCHTAFAIGFRALLTAPIGEAQKIREIEGNRRLFSISLKFRILEVQYGAVFPAHKPFIKTCVAFNINFY